MNLFHGFFGILASDSFGLFSGKEVPAARDCDKSQGNKLDRLITAADELFEQALATILFCLWFADFKFSRCRDLVRWDGCRYRHRYQLADCRGNPPSVFRTLAGYPDYHGAGAVWPERPVYSRSRSAHSRVKLCVASNSLILSSVYG